MEMYVNLNKAISEIDKLYKSDLVTQTNINNILRALARNDMAPIITAKWKRVYSNWTKMNGSVSVYECTNCGHIELTTSDRCICGAVMEGTEY